MSDEMQKGKTNYHTEEEKKKAAYALNMCTVSVSQIIDYHDSYVLEQEYDAMLNNLNFKEMPKDEALLNILTEILNVITFFRIQEIRKKQIEKKYQQRIKNAIWSAVPSLNVIVSGEPIAIAVSLATQIGSGYMNYRKEKANAVSDRENEEIELEITAIEQLNALRRELFTTSWRLAEEYGFADEWRLTEKQIKQYNEILMDCNEYRKYARLEAVSAKFMAYPPFWYFYGHTANYIAEDAKNELRQNRRETDEEKKKYNEDAAVVKKYTELAKRHYEYYYSLCKDSLLREDQLTASFALEYIDILWNEDKKDINKIYELISLAEKMGSNSLDILQLCAISYLKIGRSDNAIKILKYLVNEEYNLSTNAKLLSRLYVSQYLLSKEKETDDFTRAEYRLLERLADPEYLFPLPDIKIDDVEHQGLELQEEYLERQKSFLQVDYSIVINEFVEAKLVQYNELWPVPYFVKNINESYYTEKEKGRRDADVKSAFSGAGRKEFISDLKKSLLRVKYLDLVNSIPCALDGFSFFRFSNNKENLISLIRKNLEANIDAINEYQEKIETETIIYEDYQKIQEALSLEALTKEFFEGLKKDFTEQMTHLDIVCAQRGINPMQYIEDAEFEFTEFCRKYKLQNLEESRSNKELETDIFEDNYYFSYSVLGKGIENELEDNEKRSNMLNAVEQAAPLLVIGDKEEVEVLLPETDKFNMYFANVKLDDRCLKSNILAILDDKTKKDYDILLAYNGIVVVKKNMFKSEIDFRRVTYSAANGRGELGLDWPNIYTNKNIDIWRLHKLIQELIRIDDVDIPQEQLGACIKIINKTAAMVSGLKIAEALPASLAMTDMIIELGKVFGQNVSKAAAKDIASLAKEEMERKSNLSSSSGVSHIIGKAINMFTVRNLTEDIGWYVLDRFSKNQYDELLKKYPYGQEEEDDLTPEEGAKMAELKNRAMKFFAGQKDTENNKKL